MGQAESEGQVESEGRAESLRWPDKSVGAGRVTIQRTRRIAPRPRDQTQPLRGDGAQLHLAARGLGLPGGSRDAASVWARGSHTCPRSIRLARPAVHAARPGGTGPPRRVTAWRVPPSSRDPFHPRPPCRRGPGAGDTGPHSPGLRAAPARPWAVRPRSRPPSPFLAILAATAHTPTRLSRPAANMQKFIALALLCGLAGGLRGLSARGRAWHRPLLLLRRAGAPRGRWSPRLADGTCPRSLPPLPHAPQLPRPRPSG